MTSPLPHNTQPRRLSRRQRIALGMEPYVPIERQVREKPALLSKKYRLSVELKEPKLPLRERVEVSERQMENVAWLKNLTREQQQAWMKDELVKFAANEERERQERGDREWYASSLEDYRKLAGIQGNYYYSGDRKTVYLNIEIRNRQAEKVSIAIDAEDLERVAGLKWEYRVTSSYGFDIACRQYTRKKISLGRWIANAPAPPPTNQWGNYRPAKRPNDRQLPPSPPKLEDTEGYYFSYGPKWLEIQPMAMARANGKCERCKRKKAVHVHHILPVRYFKYPTDAHFLDNTLAVCRSCHHEEHRQLKNRFPLLNRLTYQLQKINVHAIT